MNDENYDYKAIDAVVNIFNADALVYRPEWRDQFFGDKIGASAETVAGVEKEGRDVRLFL